MFKNKSFKRDLIMVLASIAMFVVVLNMPFKAKMFGDMDFHREAKNISGFLRGELPSTQLFIIKAPGPSLFYTLPYCLVKPGSADETYWKMGLAWNFLWLIVSFVLLRKTVDKLFGEQPYNILFLLILAIPIPYYYAMGVLAETMGFMGYSMFAFGTVHFFQAMTDEKKSKYLWWACAGLVSIFLARPNILLVFGFIILILAWLHWRKLYPVQTIKQYSIGFVIATLFAYGIATAIKHLPGSTNTGSQESYFYRVAHHGRFQFREETWDWRFWDNMTRADSKDYQNSLKSTSELNAQVTDKYGESFRRVYSEWVINDVLSHPLMFAKQFAVRLLFGNYLQVSSSKPENFKFGPFKGPFYFYALMAIINGLNLAILLAAIAGFWKALKKQPYLWFLAAPVLALFVFHALVYMEQRYLYPIRPFFLLFACPFFIGLLQRSLKVFSKNQTKQTT